MKRLFVILAFLFLMPFISHSQTRFLQYSKTTGTSVDTINFDFYVSDIIVVNDGSATDTLWFWTEQTPVSQNRKIFILGGEIIQLKVNPMIITLYLQGSSSAIKRRVIAKP